MQAVALVAYGDFHPENQRLRKEVDGLMQSLITGPNPSLTHAYFNVIERLIARMVMDNNIQQALVTMNSLLLKLLAIKTCACSTYMRAFNIVYRLVTVGAMLAKPVSSIELGFSSKAFAEDCFIVKDILQQVDIRILDFLVRQPLQTESPPFSELYLSTEKQAKITALLWIALLCEEPDISRHFGGHSYFSDLSTDEDEAVA